MGIFSGVGGGGGGGGVFSVFVEFSPFFFGDNAFHYCVCVILMMVTPGQLPVLEKYLSFF